MTTHRLYLLLFGLPLLATGAMGLLFSGGDWKVAAFFLQTGLVAVALIALLSLPLVRLANRWQARPLAAVARAVGGEVRRTVGGDRHLHVPEEDGGASLLFWVETAEVAGDEAPGAPWTCVGRRRPGREGPAVEVRFRPGIAPELRWANRWWDALPRGAPPDPLAHPDAREAATALAAVFPDVETRIRADGDLIAFAVPGHVRDPAALLALFYAARPSLARIG